MSGGRGSGKRRGAGTVALAVVLLAACGPSSPSGTAELTVFAAASLRTALERLEPAWEEQTPAAPITLAMDSSAALRVQIEQGAEADAFLSADPADAAALARVGLANQPVPFASNTLVIVVPLDNPQAVRSPADLGNHGLRIVAAGEDVPLTRYAREVVDRLAGIDGYPDEFVAAYEINVASREDNARAVLAKVELGEGDAASVYATDARGSDRVQVIPIPSEAQAAVTYAAVALRGPDEARATELITWLREPGAQAILADAGFLPPP